MFALAGVEVKRDLCVFLYSLQMKLLCDSDLRGWDVDRTIIQHMHVREDYATSQTQQQTYHLWFI